MELSARNGNFWTGDTGRKMDTSTNGDSPSQYQRQKSPPIAGRFRQSLEMWKITDWMVGATGIEPVTPSMSTRCSPAELRALKSTGAGMRPYIGSRADRQGGADIQIKPPAS